MTSSSDITHQSLFLPEWVGGWVPPRLEVEKMLSTCIIKMFKRRRRKYLILKLMFLGVLERNVVLGQPCLALPVLQQDEPNLLGKRIPSHPSFLLILHHLCIQRLESYLSCRGQNMMQLSRSLPISTHYLIPASRLHLHRLVIWSSNQMKNSANTLRARFMVNFLDNKGHPVILTQSQHSHHSTIEMQSSVWTKNLCLQENCNLEKHSPDLAFYPKTPSKYRNSV